MQKITIDYISGMDSGLFAAFKELKPPLRHLFFSGNRESLFQRPKIAIVGARKMTPYGKQTTTDIARELARAGAVIISGLAIGVDSTAHRAALEVGGQTIAVLPSSIYKVYPASHARLAEEIITKNGLLISEYEEPAPPMKYQFIERNRIIAALADIVLITEAGEGSGSLHTADFALELGKTVTAVPGNIDRPMSIGTNNLIKTGAIPITSSQDILDMLGFSHTTKTQYTPENTIEKTLLDTLSNQPQSSTALIAATNLDASGFNIHITMLEIKGVVEQVGGNKWRLR